MKIEYQYQTADVRVTITIQSTTLDADKWMRKAVAKGQWDARDMAKACAEDVQRVYDERGHDQPTLRNQCDCIASGNTQKPKQHGADPHAKNCAIYHDPMYGF